MISPWIRCSGIFGVVLLGFAIVGSLLGAMLVGIDYAISSPLILTHFVLGVVLTVVWFAGAGTKSLGVASKAATGRKARFGYYAFTTVILFGAIVVGVNWIAQRYNKRWDFTEAQVYSLAPQSASIVKGLKRPLKLVGLSGGMMIKLGRNPEELKNLFDLYHYANPGKVSIEFFDPQAKPHLIEKYGYKTGNLVYLEYGEGSDKQISRISETTEEAITNAIMKLQGGEAKKIYYVTGHDEPSLTSGAAEGMKRFADAVKDEHLTIEELFLGQKESVPADAAAVVVAAPKKPFGPGEKERLISYAEKGGRLLLFVEPRNQNQEIKELAAYFGIEVGNDIIIDQIQRLFSAPQLGAQPAVTTYGTHPITKDFSTNTITIFNIASTVTATKKSEGDVTYTDLLKSSPTAWGESAMDSLFSDEPTAVLDEKDKKGPVTLAVAYEKKLAKDAQSAEGSDLRTRVVVFGDLDWIINANINVYSNRDLVLNAINWIAGEESSLSIRARSMRESLAPISEGDYLRIMGLSFVIPEAILLFGLLIWWKRRTGAIFAA